VIGVGRAADGIVHVEKTRYGKHMRDSEIVASIVAGDPDGLAEAYDRYANPLFGFCRTLLPEPADAADAVQDTFVIAASRLAGLRDPELLRPWLYAVARNECLRRLGSKEAASALDEAAEHGPADETADVAVEAERAERRELLRAALGGLNPAERDAVTQLLHGLNASEIALVLGVSRNHVHSLLSRARDQLEASVGVLLVARSGRQDCGSLDTLLTGWDGELTVPLRKRLVRHIDGCAVCSQRRRQVLSPAVLLGLSPGLLFGVAVAHIAGAAGAAHVAPAGLRAKALLMATSKDLPAEAYRGALRRSHGSFGTSGFPKPIHTSHLWLPRGPRTTAAAAVGAVAVIAAAIVLATSGGPHHGGVSAAGPLRGQRAGQSPGTAPGTAPGGGPSARSGGGSAGSGGSGVSASPLASRSGSGGSPSPSGSLSPTGSAPGSGSATPSAPSTSSAPTGSPTVTPTVSGSATPTPSPTPTPTSQPAPGTLAVSPTTIVLSPGLGETITLTAEGGPVSWSVSEPSSLLGELSVAPSSGTLQSGQSAQVTITVSGLASLDTQLTVSPGGQQVTVVLGLL
jgi:RNA polymerase sigma factor (sigma-70 family)